MDWQPSATIDTLQQRAKFIQSVRQFFIERSFLEVETPCMGAYGITDAYLSNIVASWQDKTYYLQTSPEYYMKRLLASGSGPIFQIAKAFRDDEHGRWHQPEFTMLECYQLDINHIQLIQLLDELFQSVCHWPAIKIMTYGEAFNQFCDVNPYNSTIEVLRRVLVEYKLDKILSWDEEDIDQYLFLIMAEVIEPKLSQYDFPIALIDFPSSQAALAQVINNKAQRFELYYKGIELANGFQELTDVKEQSVRFQRDNELRVKQNKPTMEPDALFLLALKHGLPACSGVAVGLDRVMALLLEKCNIQDVMAFSE